MLRTLVQVLDFGCITRRFGGAGKRHIAFMASFGIFDAVGFGLLSDRFRWRLLSLVRK
jgi:hypothetical protein